MKKFKFNLESLLSIRDWEEQNARQKLSQANAFLGVMERNVANLSERLETEAASWLNGSAKGSFSPNQRMALDGSMSLLKKEILEAERRRDEALRKREMAMSALVEASRAKKIVENLKEKRLEEYTAELYRAEAAEIDDIFNSRRRAM